MPNMIRYTLQEMMAQRSFERGSTITITEISEATGISKNTLSRLINVRGYTCNTSVIDGLCKYFECEVGDLMMYVAEEHLGTN